MFFLSYLLLVLSLHSLSSGCEDFPFFYFRYSLHISCFLSLRHTVFKYYSLRLIWLLNKYSGIAQVIIVVTRRWLERRCHKIKQNLLLLCFGICLPIFSQFFFYFCSMVFVCVREQIFQEQIFEDFSAKDLRRRLCHSNRNVDN